MALSNVSKIFDDVSWSRKLLGGSVLVGGLIYLLKHRFRKTTKRKENPKDTVIVHHHLRGEHTPSITPFAVKLETYLRMAKIPFETVISWERSTKGKIPWIEYNNESIADSEFCIQFLNKERGVNLNSHLTPEQEGAGRAFQKMVEENTYWILALDRWIFYENNGISVYYNVPWILRRRVKNMVRNQTYNHGIGRHSKEEIFNILRLDLSALSKYLVISRRCLLVAVRTQADFLGAASPERYATDTEHSIPLSHIILTLSTPVLPLSIIIAERQAGGEKFANFSVLGSKKFLFGDRACQYDCAVFGILSLGLWDGFGGKIPEIVKEYPNLCTYCENMKREYWPDWDECTMEGEKKKEK